MADQTDFDRFEAAGWSSEARAASYGGWFTRISRGSGPALLDAVGAGPGTQLLDLACGPGPITEQALERGAEVTGADFSEAMLRVARANLPRARFIRQDAQEMTLEEGGFDAVVANLLLLHVSDPAAVARESLRVLRPGGRAAFTVWATPDRCRFSGTFVDAFRQSGFPPPPEVPVGPAQFGLAEEGGAEMARLLETAGFVEVRGEEVAMEASFPDSDDYWDGFMSSSVRIAGMIRPQPAPIQAAIRAEWERLLEPHRVGGQVVVSANMIMGSGTRPG